MKRSAEPAAWGGWAQVAAAAVAVWLMAAPAALGYAGAAATSDRVVGPIAASFACMAIWPVLRSLRWVNVALGVWLVAAPWLLGYAGAEPTALANSTATGLALVALSLVRGRRVTEFGGGWRAVLGRGQVG